MSKPTDLDPTLAPSPKSLPDWPHLVQKVKDAAYWNILQKSVSCLDLVRLDQEGQQFAENLIRQLLEKGKFQAEIKGTIDSSELLQHLYQESTNRSFRKGKNELGLGFPLLVLHDPESKSRPIVAPLFIWPVELQPSPNRINAWSIKYNEKSGLEPNYYLIKYLENEQQNELLDRYRQLGTNSKLNQAMLSRWCYDLIVHLELADQRSIREVMPLPNDFMALDLAKRGAVYWSGALSLFPAQLPTALDNRLGAAPQKSTAALPQQDHLFGLLQVDPHQKSALTVAPQNRFTLVKGLPGSGKTFALSNLLSNALSNGKKCLVISENQSSFKQIELLLEELGLQQLSLRLNSPTKDISELLDQMKQVVEQSQSTIEFDEATFNLFLNKCKRDHQRLDANYQALKAQNFGTHNWSETVGYFLQSNRSEGKELLRSQLNPNDFVFDYASFQQLSETVLESEPLYRQLGTFKHPLQNLNHHFFELNHPQDARKQVEQETQRFLKKAAQLHHRYILKTDQYAESLTEHYEHHFQSMSTKLRELEEHIADGISQFGDDFAEPGMVGKGKLRVYGVFYNKYKNILSAREYISEAYHSLLRLYEQSKYFDYQFTEGSEQRKVKKIQQQIKDFKPHLNQWHKSIPAIVQEEIQRLSNKTVHPDMDYHAQIEDLEYALDLLIEELNESELYQGQFENKMLTIPMRQQYLESIIEQLDTTLYNIRDFEVFFDWYRHWLQLDPASKKLIHALIKVKPNHWLAAFESWYLHNRLHQDYQIAISQDDELFQRFTQSYATLQKLLPTQIKVHWQKKQKEAIKQFRKKDRSLYQSLFQKNDKGNPGISSSQLWQQTSQVISKLFPILLCDVATANEVLSKQQFDFDWLIFDDAQRYDCASAHPCMKMGKQIIAFQDETFRRSDGVLTLAQYLEEQGCAQVQLKNQQRVVAKSIARFNQQVVFQQKETPLSNESDHKNALQVFALQGQYNTAKRINHREAEQVIRLLNKVEKTAEHRYPQIAVVASTTAQRNYIAKLLLELKQRKSMGHEKMLALETAGLKIYDLSELAGIHPEVLFFSFTYGYTEGGKQLTEDMDFFQSPAGLQAYHLLVSRPSQQLIFIHSLPKDLIANYLLRPREDALSLLAKHFCYAQAVQENNSQEQKRLLSSTKEQYKVPLQNSLFIRELANDLRSYLGSGRILLNASIENLRLPLVIKPIHEWAPPFVIQIDGFFSDSETGAFLWEQQLRKKLQFLGLEYYPVWSVNWWKNPKQEARKLASIIIKKDAAYASENQHE